MTDLQRWHPDPRAGIDGVVVDPRRDHHATVDIPHDYYGPAPSAHGGGHVRIDVRWGAGPRPGPLFILALVLAVTVVVITALVTTAPAPVTDCWYAPAEVPGEVVRRCVTR